MPSRKEKTGFLLLGIFIGLIVAASIFWWQRSIHAVDWVPFGNVKQLVDRLFDEPDDFLAQLKTRFTPGSSKNARPKASRQADSLAISPVDSLYIDSLNAYYNSLGIDYYIDYSGLPESMIIPEGQHIAVSKADSLWSSDTSTVAAAHQKDLETVKRDEFLSSRLVRIEGMKDSTAKKGAYLDSLLTDERNAKAGPGNRIRVEFWKSPINYKGYRLTQDKLQLFGISDADAISLELIQKQLYLRQKQQLYLLKPSSNFLPLTPAKNLDRLSNVHK